MTVNANLLMDTISPSQRDVLLDPKQNCECCAPPSDPLLFVGHVDFLVIFKNCVHILIDPILLVQYVEIHKTVIS